MCVCVAQSYRCKLKRGVRKSVTLLLCDLSYIGMERSGLSSGFTANPFCVYVSPSRGIWIKFEKN